MSDIQTQLTALNAQFDNAFNSKDAAKVAQLYDANATVLPAPAGTPVIGNAAIQTFFGGLIDAGVIEHKLEQTQAAVDGNLAYQWGKWSGAMISADNQKQTFGGNVHLVYRKQADGNWKAVSHIWN